MYKCNNCGYVFDEPMKYCDDYTPGGAFEGGSFLNYYNGCPMCASSYEEAEECSQCGDLKFSGEMVDNKFICDECIKELSEDESLF